MSDPKSDSKRDSGHRESTPDVFTETQDPQEASADPNSTTSTRAPYRQCAPDHFRTRIHVEYDGTDFAGWQRQTTHTTVQGTLEAAVSRIYAKKIAVIGASRTDSGVHAYQQVAHFDIPRDPSTFDLRYAIQCLTPPTVVIREMFLAAPDFHAIACVNNKTYKYRILNRRVPSALQHRYTYWVRFPLDVDYLNKASSFVVGKQDFKSFQTSGTPVSTTVRNVLDAHWTQLDDDILEFSVTGDGFLKQMVRNMVGTLINLNQEDQPPEKIREILDACDRRKAGPTAPPQGLFLHKVNYPEHVDIKCRKL